MGPAQAAALAVRLRSAVGDERVLGAIAAMPRERFVPLAQRSRAYENVALPIACGQTISQPLVVARMLETLQLQPDDRVLDIGTGSGYHAALLARLARHVWTIERHREAERRRAGRDREPGHRQHHVRGRRRLSGACVAGTVRCDQRRRGRRRVRGRDARAPARAGRAAGGAGRRIRSAPDAVEAHARRDRALQARAGALRAACSGAGLAGARRSRITSIATGFESTSTNRLPRP